MKRFWLALLVVFVLAAPAAAQWHTTDARILVKPQAAGYQSILYDEVTSEFVVVYYRPDLWLARCTPDACTQEPVVLDEYLSMLYLFRDEFGLGIADNTPGGIVAYRETDTGWQSEQLVPADICTSLGRVTHRPTGELAVLCNKHAEGNRVAWREGDTWSYIDAPFDVGPQGLAFSDDGTIHGMRVRIYEDPDRRFEISHVHRAPGGEWVDDIVLADFLYTYYSPQSWGVVVSGDYVHLFYRRSDEAYGQLTIDPEGNVEHLFSSDKADYYEYEELHLLSVAALPAGEATFSRYRYFYFQTDAPGDVIAWGSGLSQGGHNLRSIGGDSSFDPAAEFWGYAATAADGTPHNVMFNYGSWYYFDWPDVVYNYDHEDRADEKIIVEPTLWRCDSRLLVAAEKTPEGLRPFLQTMMIHGFDYQRLHLFGKRDDLWPVAHRWGSGSIGIYAPQVLALSAEGAHALDVQEGDELTYELFTWTDDGLVYETAHVAEPPDYQQINSADLISAGDEMLLGLELSRAPGIIRLARRPAGGPFGEAAVVAETGRHPRVAVCPDGSARIVYRDGTNVMLGTEGEPWTTEVVAAGYELSRGHGVCCTDTGEVHVVFDDGVDAYHATQAADSWTVTSLQSGAKVEAVQPDETGNPWAALVVDLEEGQRAATLFHWTGAAWESEVLSDAVDAEMDRTPFGLWAGEGEVLACYALENKVECVSTAPLVNSMAPGDDDDDDNDDNDDNDDDDDDDNDNDDNDDNDNDNDNHDDNDNDDDDNDDDDNDNDDDDNDDNDNDDNDDDNGCGK